MTEIDKKAEFLIEAMPYIEKYRNKILVIKYDGNAMLGDKAKIEVMRDLTLLRCVGVKVVLVHGGGPEISETLSRMGVSSKFVNGLRYTDGETAEVVRMVLSGKVNKSLVHILQSLGAKAVGLSGMDGGMLLCEKLDEKLGFVVRTRRVTEESFLAVRKKIILPFISRLGLVTGAISIT